MKKIVLLSSALVASLLAGQLPEFEIKPTVSKVLTEGNSRIDDYSMIGLELSKKIYEDMMLTLGFAKGDTDYKNSARDTDIKLYTLGAEYYLYAQNNFQTFLHTGVSYQSLSRKLNGRDSGYRFNYGAGMKYYVSDAVNIFTKVSHLTDFGKRKNELHLVAGLGFALGRASQPTQSEQTLTKELEQKKVQEVVEEPEEVKLVEPTVAVAKEEEPKCSDVPPGFTVDKDGCPISYNLKVLFAFDSSQLTQESIENINTFAQYLKVVKKYIQGVEIAGHTDSVGSKEYNRLLSEHRAKAVYERLIQKGIDKDFMTYKGYGEEQPIVENDTEENRALNRRVEARLIR